VADGQRVPVRRRPPYPTKPCSQPSLRAILNANSSRSGHSSSAASGHMSADQGEREVVGTCPGPLRPRIRAAQSRSSRSGAYKLRNPGPSRAKLGVLTSATSSTPLHRSDLRIQEPPEPPSLTNHSCSPTSALGPQRASEDEKPGEVQPDGVLLVDRVRPHAGGAQHRRPRQREELVASAQPSTATRSLVSLTPSRSIAPASQNRWR
jgi:hypothetical protein